MTQCAARTAEPGTLTIPRADLALTRFVQFVVDTNPRIQAAQSALEARGAARDAASQPLYNPELRFDAENSDTDTISIGISQTLDLGRKRQALPPSRNSAKLVNPDKRYIENYCW